MKKIKKNLVVSGCGLSLNKTKWFIGASPDHLMTCNCCEDGFVKIKYPLLINYETTHEKNLNYLYKKDSEIKLKTNNSCFTILQTAVTNRKLCYLVVWTPHGNVEGY